MDGSKEIAAIEIFADNVTYEITAPLKLALSAGVGKAEKLIPRREYTSRELNAFLADNITLTPLSNDPRVIKTNKLANITELNFQLSELDNTNNLLDGTISNNLMTYHTPEYADVTSFEPKTLNIRKSKLVSFNHLR